MDNLQKDEKEDIKSELIDVIASLAVVNGAIVDKGGVSKNFLEDNKYDSFSGMIKKEAKENVEKIYGENKTQEVLEIIIGNFSTENEMKEEKTLAKTIKTGNEMAKEKMERYTKIKNAIENHLEKVSKLPKENENDKEL